jgi:hypothetical protein
VRKLWEGSDPFKRNWLQERKKEEGRRKVPEDFIL